MNGTPDEDLRRLFAQAAPVPPDEAFVAALTRRVAARRRRLLWERSVMRVLLVLAVAGLAVLLAPYAPVSPGSATSALMQLPEHAASLAVAGQWPRVNYAYLSLMLAGLPLAVTAWMLRRR